MVRTISKSYEMQKEIGKIYKLKPNTITCKPICQYGKAILDYESDGSNKIGRRHQKDYESTQGSG